MYWETLINEVKNKNNGVNARIENKIYQPRRLTMSNTNINRGWRAAKQKASVYLLGEKYPGIYFTRREAECMSYFIKGQTIVGVAQKLNISPRTVEIHLTNMKRKLQCQTKHELIGKVFDSEFMSNIDF